MENAYLNGKMSFGYEETISVHTSNEILQDIRDSLILKNMEQVYGVIPANAIIKYVSQHVGKSRLVKAVYCHPAYLTYMQSTS